MGKIWRGAPSFQAFARWFMDAPSAALVDWAQIWTDLGAMIPLSVAWIYVKKMNRDAARQLDAEIAALKVHR